ncbi:carbon-nitrogen hydrolase family protein [Clostridioides mangenotii]|uniref:carbon-nitrogen hydrolase family protein n=1 Tax=Metaclostridioides mangenotii TaxID=1540 RepID=UPI001C110CCA|nr:carbon-nitrogen hydrolase family protein [Clostridioides mangenotii]MBU5307395.1 carbon-nitrogen hydrolase family protein [Clostridioides mangenotii]MCR1954042.1 carbon-nitrogen hydrolase family protein [Clostridioides mangenotii]
MSKYKIAVCQMKTTDNKKQNIDNAVNMVNTAKNNEAELVILPEMFNCPYENKYFPEFAEEYPGVTSQAMSNLAKNNNIYLVAGSIPELCDGNIYNTCYFFNKNGDLIGRHRKMHLFDIDVKNKVYFKESDTLSAGNKVTIVDTDLGKVGIAICYDIRFPELSRIMALEGAEIIILPAAFNMTTGPAHWELSVRMRALDNQVFFVGAAPARNNEASYTAYGNSRIANPWGEIIASADENECIIYADIDRTMINSIREQLPLLKHRRTDVY